MNLLETLRKADALSLDDEFVRFFSLEDFEEPDDYVLLLAFDGLDDFNFTNADCVAAVFNSIDNSWEIKDGNNDPVTIKAFMVTQITE